MSKKKDVNIDEALQELDAVDDSPKEKALRKKVERLETSNQTLTLALKIANVMNSIESWNFWDLEKALKTLFAVWEITVLKSYDWVLSKYWPWFIKPAILERIEQSIQNKKSWDVIVCKWDDNLIFLPDGVIYLTWVKKLPQDQINQILTLGLGNIRYVADNIERDANFDEATWLSLDS